MGVTTRANYNAKKMFANCHITEKDDKKADLGIAISSLVRNFGDASIEKTSRGDAFRISANGKIAIIDVNVDRQRAIKAEEVASRGGFHYFNATSKEAFKNWFEKFTAKRR
ncbi:MAG: hypothetical protein KIT80_16080 [Chitinophagaceae bacterium]|nr:hypothetical protein [Chitinophagaceae bacterium]MCW5928435.1 hypothetical protein [Chitinophagaceae bacterium]